MENHVTRLRAVKLVHTVAWAFFATAIVLIPVAAWVQAWSVAWILIGVVSIECLVVALNGMRCPLTPLAARYTDNRADNFDIYLPLWLARYNKQVFGTLFVAAVVFTVARQMLLR